MKNHRNENSQYLGKSRKNTGELIQDITEKIPVEFKKTEFANFIKSLSPLQFASEKISEIIYYKHQIKILELEQNKIEAEAKIRHHQINAALHAGLKLLEERRVTLHMTLQVVCKDLEHSQIEKKELLDCIDNLVKNISNPSLSLDEKKISFAAISHFTELLKNIGEQNIIKLDLIAKNTQKALEAMPRSELTFSLGYRG